MPKENFKIKLESFEGPLDLLLHLIDKNKVDIYDIPIVTITDQYISYVDAMRVKDMDIMSEFLLMAATLLSIKSRMLIPKLRGNDEEESIDPRMELVERLVEYKMYKEISLELGNMQVESEHSIFKAKTLPKEVEAYEEPVNVNELLGDLTLNRLNNIFKEVVKRQSQRQDRVRAGFGKIKKEEFSLEERILEVTAYADCHERFTFLSMFDDAHTRMQVIITFLALLELIKSGYLKIIQKNIFEDIIIERCKGAVHA